MMPMLNRMKAEFAGDRLERLGRLLRGLDVGLAVGVQRRGRGQHDEEGDDVRHAHADTRSPRRCAEADAGACCGFSSKGASLGSASSSSTSCELCQKNRYGLIVVPNTATTSVSESPDSSKRGSSAPFGDFVPVEMHGEDDADIGEQREGQPLQHVDIAVIGNEHGAEQATEREQHGVEVLAAADRQLARRRPSPTDRRRY